MKFCRILIFVAALFGNAGCMERSAYGKTVEDIFSTPDTQNLARAACNGDSEEVDRLIAKGADVTDIGLFKVTPLIWALTCKDIEFPDILASRVEHSSSQVMEPVEPDYLAGLKSLLAAGANANQMIDGDFGPIYPGGDGYWIDHYTPVLIAAEFHQAPVLQLLLQYGGDPNAVDGNNEHTALSLAFDRARWLDLGTQMAPFDKRQWESFYFLLSNGAEPSSPTASRGNVIRYATMNRPDIAYDVVKKYGYSGNLDEIASIMISAIRAGFPDEDRRKFLDFLKTEKNVDIDMIWREANEYNAETALTEK
jgi:ankyrin repeat protein